MIYDLHTAMPILERTPKVFRTLLSGIPEEWIIHNEGENTFSAFDVVGHLIHGEKTDWPARIKMILEQGTSQTFISYDRFAMYEESNGKLIEQLLDEFEICRKENLVWLGSLNLQQEDLEKKGMHPSLGEVSLRQLLSTWVIHDLTHIAQVARVMAKQYKGEMGPWLEYFRIMDF